MFLQNVSLSVCLYLSLWHCLSGCMWQTFCRSFFSRIYAQNKIKIYNQVIPNKYSLWLVFCVIHLTSDSAMLHILQSRKRYIAITNDRISIKFQIKIVLDIRYYKLSCKDRESKKEKKHTESLLLSFYNQSISLYLFIDFFISCVLKPLIFL